MRKTPWLTAERYREKAGSQPKGQEHKYGDPYGRFILDSRNGTIVCVVSSDGGWEHVSVSLRDRTPVHVELAFIKDLFWREDETVVYYYPPKAEHVNFHPHCLHLWRPVTVELPRPPRFMVGPYHGWEEDVAAYFKAMKEETHGG